MGGPGSAVLVLWVAPACFFLVDYGFLMMNPQGEHYIHMHAVRGVWWRVPGGAGAGAAWVVESWPRAMARDLHGCGGSDRQESTR